MGKSHAGGLSGGFMAPANTAMPSLVISAAAVPSPSGSSRAGISVLSLSLFIIHHPLHLMRMCSPDMQKPITEGDGFLKLKLEIDERRFACVGKAQRQTHKDEEHSKAPDLVQRHRGVKALHSLSGPAASYNGAEACGKGQHY